MRRQREISAGVIVFHRDGDTCRFLLLLSRLTKRPLWEFPKGGVESGETVLQAALRELEEETGLSGSDIRLVPSFEATERYRFTIADGKGEQTLIHKRVTYYLAEALHRRVRRSEKESHRHAWLTVAVARRRLRYRERRTLLERAAAAAGCGEPDGG